MSQGLPAGSPGGLATHLPPYQTVASRKRGLSGLSAQVERGIERQPLRLEPSLPRGRPALESPSPGLICASQKKRAEAKAKIAEEKKYADEGGGVVDQAAK
jgi:hypothetical protein